MPTPQKIRCRVETLRDHGQHVYTVGLVPEKRLPAYRPGQFLHLALDDYDPSGFWPESRPFSIANSPAGRDRLRIVYSVQGRFSARMEQELAVGKNVWVKLPYGDFVIDGTSSVALFAGGTGISAFMAFLEGLTPAFTHAVYLFYGARRAPLLLYRSFIEELAHALPQVRPCYFVEEPYDGAMALSEGRLSVAAAWPKLPDPLSLSYYLSGPPAMLKAISQDLRQRQVPGASIHIDAWE
jgi:ferredoxin-NADP reductase